MNKQKKKILTASITTAILLGAVAPLPLQAKAATQLSSEELPTLSQEEVAELLEAQQALQDAGITAEDMASGIASELPEGTVEDTNSSGTFTTMGVKSQAAKVAAKAMVKKLGRIGQVAWDRTVTTYINKLPIPSGAKTVMKKYLKYHFVMEVLDAVVDFSGTITDGLSAQFQKIGVPAWLSDTCARVLVTLLL